MNRTPSEVVRFTVEVPGHTCLLMYHAMLVTSCISSEAFRLIVEEATPLGLGVCQATISRRQISSLVQQAISMLLEANGATWAEQYAKQINGRTEEHRALPNRCATHMMSRTTCSADEIPLVAHSRSSALLLAPGLSQESGSVCRRDRLQRGPLGLNNRQVWSQSVNVSRVLGLDPSIVRHSPTRSRDAI